MKELLSLSNIEINWTVTAVILWFLKLWGRIPYLGRLVAIIAFNMRNIWKAVPDSYTTTHKTKCEKDGRMHSEKNNSIKLKMADLP